MVSWGMLHIIIGLAGIFGGVGGLFWLAKPGRTLTVGMDDYERTQPSAVSPELLAELKEIQCGKRYEEH